MPDLYLSLQGNTLKFFLHKKEGVYVLNKEVPHEIASESSIIDRISFSNLITQTIKTDFENLKPKNINLVYLAEPQDVKLTFVTVAKDQITDLEAHIVSSAQQQLSLDLNDYYFSYQKIAPFVYQFIATQKEYLDKILEIFSTSQISLKGVVPWILTLPKYLGTSEHCVFLSKDNLHKVVALSELNGIYYVKEYNDETALENLDELITNNSVYKYKSSSVNYYQLRGNLDLDEKYNVQPLISQLTDTIPEGYEEHAIVKHIFTQNPELFMSQLNILNLLPVPVVVKSKAPVVYAGVSALVLLLLLGIGGYFGYTRFYNKTDTDLEQGGIVLSENTAQEQPSEQQTNQEQPQDDTNTNTEQQEPIEVIFRVENGAGIAGLAGNTQTYLEGKEYTVDSIGDADEVGRDTTLLIYNPKLEDQITDIVDDLKQDYDIELQNDLDDDLDYNVLMIVGKN